MAPACDSMEQRIEKGIEDSRKKSYYSVVPANVRYDKSLCPNTKLLYGEITCLCNEKGYCWASNGYFAKLYGKDTRTITRWIGQLTKRGYIRVQIDKKSGNKRRIYLSTKMSTPTDSSVHTPSDNCVQQNSKDTILKANKIRASSGDLSEADAQAKAYKLLIRYGVQQKVAHRIVFEWMVPPRSIREAVKNGLAKQDCEKGFELGPGYIVQALKQARKEGKVVRPTERSRKLKRRIGQAKKHRDRGALSPKDFQKRKERQLAALRAG